ncbi:MAG: acyltransferase family protein [Acidimicrobiales bacterium]
MAIDTTLIGPPPGRLDIGSWPRRAARPATASMPYVPALDGLRALAVAAVLLYHGDVSWMPGGFLGVEVFFVISGYLITALLLAERQTTGGTAFLRFWARRARRLLPALFALLTAVAIAWLVWHPGEVARIRGDLVASLAYVTNWYQIIVGQSYVEALGRPSPLRHLWSLAVEEQFYLVWPVALALLVRVTRGRRTPMVVATLAFAAGSALLGAALFKTGVDPLRPYYGTDTRAAGVLLGAALAIAAPPWSLRAHLARRSRVLLAVAGVVGLVGIGWMCMRANEFDPFVYRGGFVLLDLFTLALIAALVHPGASGAGRAIGAILGSAPLVWIGRRSYGIYLWHWPIFMLTRPDLDVDPSAWWGSGWRLLAVRIGLTLLVAELSYVFIEMPVRDGRLRAALERRSAMSPSIRATARFRQGWAAVAVVAVMAVVVTGLVRAPRPPDEISGVDLAGVVTDDLGNVTDLGDADATSTVPTTLPANAAMLPPLPPTTLPPIVPIAGQEITAIGDSVLLGSRHWVDQQFPGVLINAEVGRQFGVLPGLLPALRDYGALRPVVIVHLGTNGPPTDGDLREILDELAGARRVVLVTTHDPRAWQDDANARLVASAAGRANVVVVDWHATSESHPEWFVKDGVHLTQEGGQAYAEALATGLR